ncbi:Rpn family recombination-promoting nuclease/putative transposase [Parapedobacter tibetensis]|uniref:Rpn family recombination-promoting nuclease/putative transposase n=1 Tax=Parapedobacter tibetensis TaxID=2972951 RepID=UPI00214DC119|nr:Rpn family recombination-promoting nuclease/putative transposase [Parapedobacter tibetensis]
MANITSAHDKFVRQVLSDHQAAVDYFRTALPVHIADKLDFTTLERQSGSYVSKELEKTVSDVVYTCRRHDGKGSVNVSLLIEHKSAPDKYTPIQVGGYLFSGYQQQIKQGRKQLTPIIPILLYHGRNKWEYHTLEQLFDESAEDLLDFLPNFDYVYHNLREAPEEHIHAISNRYLAGSLLMLKYALDKHKLKGKLPQVLSIGLSQGSKHQQIALLIYSFEVVDFTEEQIKEILKGLPKKIKDKVMSTYDLLVEKGRKEERAKAQRLIEQERAKAEQERAKAYAEKLNSASEFKKMGVPVEDIAKGLQLSVEDVEKL